MITGIVDKVLTKAWNGKTFYSLALVNDKIYGFGMFKPSANVGDTVSFEAKENAKGYMEADKTTLKVTKGESKVVSGGSVRASSMMGKDDYWSRKEARDIENDKLRTIGASRNTAIAWVDLLIKAEALKLPTKVSEREDALALLLDEYTNRFMGVEPKTAAEAGSDEPEAPAAAEEEWS